MPQHIIDMYLCKDGKTIHNSSEYEWSQDGDNSMNATFRNRDLRLLETVAPPYKVIPSADNTSWEYTSDPKDREFMDIMGITRYTGFGGGNGDELVCCYIERNASLLHQQWRTRFPRSP